LDRCPALPRTDHGKWSRSTPNLPSLVTVSQVNLGIVGPELIRVAREAIGCRNNAAGTSCFRAVAPHRLRRCACEGMSSSPGAGIGTRSGEWDDHRAGLHRPFGDVSTPGAAAAVRRAGFADAFGRRFGRGPPVLGGIGGHLPRASAAERPLPPLGSHASPCSRSSVESASEANSAVE
jgi:hypothetical protein